MPIPTRHMLWQALLVIAIVGGGFALRLFILDQAPVSYDEDNYLSAARTFRELIQAGEWDEFPQVTNNREHPPLVKILYSLTLVESELEAIPPQNAIFRGSNLPLPPRSLDHARLQSVLASTLTILVVTLTNPLAGLSLAGLSMHWYYGSLAYLDALPTCMTAWAAALYIYSVRQPTPRYQPTAFWLSAVFFGIGVAAKYPFGLVGVILVAHAVFLRHVKIPKMIAWGIVSLVAFYLFNPYIYPDPINRTREQLTFHEEYAEKYGDRQLLRPITQLTDARQFLPVNLYSPVGHGADLLIFGLAVVGIYPLLKQKSFYGWWLVGGMLFLMAWNTQWPQHKMMVVVPYSLSAGAGGLWLWGLFRARFYPHT